MPFICVYHQIEFLGANRDPKVIEAVARHALACAQKAQERRGKCSALN
mgnify:CR=1 FL=1